MKDAYSFDKDLDGLPGSRTTRCTRAYEQVFTRCGLTFRSVKAQSGEIGGDTSQEFMAVAAVGEDAFVWCEHCDYAANTEAATKQEVPAIPAPDDAPAKEKLHTPDLPGIEGVAKFLEDEAEPVAEVHRVRRRRRARPGDRARATARSTSSRWTRSSRTRRCGLSPTPTSRRIPSCPKGYIGPDFEGAKHVVADSSVRAPHPWITGANEIDHHVQGSVLGRDFTPTQWAEIAVVEPGDACPKCGQPLRIDRGIEVGHVFQLGTKYTEALGAHYTDEEGEQHPMVMGCYGIGVSRIVAAIVEEHHDENGIAWPSHLAPFDVHVIAMPGDETASEAEKLSAELCAAGLDVLYDDREGRPGREVRRRGPRRRAGADHRRRQGSGSRRRRAQGPRDGGARRDPPRRGGRHARRRRVATWR